MDASTPSATDAGLDKPLYGATIGQAFIRFWRKYAILHGRSSRSEFWWWFLIYVAIGIMLSVTSQLLVGAAPPDSSTSMTIRRIMETSIASTTWSLINFVGGVSVTVRRLHDTDKSGWWWFIQLIPIIGSITMIIFVVLPTNPAGSRFDR